MKQEILDQIEQIIDDHSLQGVLEALMEICAAKEEHLLSNWQDKTSANCWKRDAIRISAIAQKVEN